MSRSLVQTLLISGRICSAFGPQPSASAVLWASTIRCDHDAYSADSSGFGDSPVPGGGTRPGSGAAAAGGAARGAADGPAVEDQWSFNFDAGWGNFGFANSLFDQPERTGVEESLSDQWFEGFVKPALSASYTPASSSEIFGKVSAVGERTYGSVPAAFGERHLVVRARRSLHRLAIGQGAGRLAKTPWISLSDARSTRWDTASCSATATAEGGSRGGYWTTPGKRSSWRRSAASTRGPQGGKLLSRQGRTSGARHRDPVVGRELRIGSIGEDSTLGATYLSLMADAEFGPNGTG